MRAAAPSPRLGSVLTGGGGGTRVAVSIGVRFLVIEDDRDDAELIQALVRRTWDVEVEIAGSAGEAERLVDAPGARAPFDLLMLDVGLPDGDGIELCRRLRSRPALGAVPIVVVSARTSEHHVEAALEAGATDYVCKPVRARELMARIRAALRDQERRARALDAKQALERAAAELHAINRDLARQSAVDPLTQLANRREFDLTLQREWRRAARGGMWLAVVMTDVDHFHEYNDRHGHLRGDACLVAVAGALRAAALRPTDRPARWGGEEFAYVLPDTDLSGAVLVAERIRHEVAALRVAHGGVGPGPWVTVSVGVAATQPGSGRSADELLAAADAAMFRAKRLGRDRVCSD